MTDWPHAPPHRLFEPGTYMITCGTYKKAHFLNHLHRLDYMLQALFNCAAQFGWQLHAWAILSNHYHFVASSLKDPRQLRTMLSKLHTLSARQFNGEDGATGRRVWFQYHDSRITYQRSYLARLKYVHYNPVKHGVVTNAADYKWCSAAWFERKSETSFCKTVKSFKIDRLNVSDDFDSLSPSNKSGVKPPHSIRSGI